MKLLIHYSFYETSNIVIIIIGINLHRPQWGFIASVVDVNISDCFSVGLLVLKQKTKIWDILGFKQILFDDWQSAFVTVRVF